jgi:hypothetical protein
MLLGELLRQVDVVEADIDGGHETDDLVPESRRQASWRGTASTLVDERACALLLKPTFKPPDMANAHVERLGDLPIR